VWTPPEKIVNCFILAQTAKICKLLPVTAHNRK
jgi:hypothetical protein